MMVDTNCEDESNSTCLNVSALWKKYPTMATQLRRYELDDKIDYSGYDSYRIVDRSDDDMDISNIDTYIRIQETSRPRKR